MLFGALTEEQVISLVVNCGAAVSVIASVVLFLAAMRKRDDKWFIFMTNERRAWRESSDKKTEAIKHMAESDLAVRDTERHSHQAIMFKALDTFRDEQLADRALFKQECDANRDKINELVEAFLNGRTEKK